MKFNSRLLIRELCAAGAVALASAILIAGCATGEHTGKFWNKNDVASSDAYVAAEMARDQSFAANNSPAAGANGKVATVAATQAATQDGTTGRVAVPDFADQPPAPLTPPAAVDVTSSPKADAGRAAAGGAAAGSAQTATVVAGGAQTAGDVAAGSIVAPYVQKRAPSGAFDNSRHDDEIVKPKQVFGKQFDPFAATDAEPAVVPPILTRQTPPAAPASRAVNSAPTLASATAPAATAHATLSNANPWPDADSAAPPVVSTKPNVALTVIQQAPAPPAVASSLPAAVAVPAATADAFDPSLPPPVPVSATSTPADASTQPAPVSNAASAPRPNAFAAPKSAVAAAPAHPHSGIRLGDEDLDESQPGPPHTEEKQVVEPAATQVTAEAHPPVAATPYEADRPPVCVTTQPACVTTPHAARVTVPASPPPTQDSWESTKASKPGESSAPVPAPAPVTARDLAPMELAPRQHAPALPAAAESVPVVSAPIQTSAAPSSDAPITAVAEQERVVTAKVYAEHHKTGSGSDPMICDSASVHGKYTGGDEPPLAAAPQNPHDAAAQGPKDVIHLAIPAHSATPAAKKAAATDRKTAYLWDDPFASGTSTRGVLTADFSVPAPPGPFEADDAKSIGLHATTAGQQSACAGAECSSRRSRSRAWIAIGIAGALAAITVVWRRRRPHGEQEIG
jgi:hypothetical protein